MSRNEFMFACMFFCLSATPTRENLKKGSAKEITPR